MSAFQTLPFEILSQMVSSLPRSSVYQCMLVCKIWYWTSIGFFYKDFTLQESNLHSKPHSLFLLKTSKSSNLIKHGHLIKSLKVNTDDSFNPCNPWQSFHQILLYLPSVTAIDLSTSRFWKAYLSLLEAHKRRGNLPLLRQIILLHDEAPFVITI
ncbi:hypothetical protein EDC94DRAFT_656902 [Helicostylum pulchrum]|nr:hypothetical protein EDC94DRAFT_656902 [Helicostylum pulchrum]